MDNEKTNAGLVRIALEKALARTYAPVSKNAIQISDLSLLTGGAASQTWRFILTVNDEKQALILRLAHHGEQFGGALDKTSESIAQSAAFRHGVPVAEIVAVLAEQDGLGDGYIMQYIEGETLPKRILKDPVYAEARGQMAGQCAEILYAIHSVPTDQVKALPQRDVSQQLGELYRYFNSYHEALPVFYYAFRWLRNNIPTEANKSQSLVHGDFRNGNFIVNEHGIVCVLDWELSHIGDPMEDLGWLCVNSWRFGQDHLPVGGFGTREDLYTAYENASGQSVDPEVISFWEVFGILKWGVICLYQTHVHLSGKERSVERAAIGRRVSECELDLADLLSTLVK